RLRLLQRYPAFVIRVGRAELALDGELAGRIRVRVE
ncbi:MAG: ferrous iron transport protein A, partial [Gemmatimonadetes bacterium]|nr:ferrous iron transport protein A [Gemmatimonadota bacterium]